MSSQSKEWIKQRITTLKKQTGFAFNQDLFISVLLCLVSGNDKHLFLTAPQHRLQEVSQMTTMICRSLFGFSTANVTCQAHQSPTDLVQSLFAATREELVSEEPSPLPSTLYPNSHHHNRHLSHQRNSDKATKDSSSSTPGTIASQSDESTMHPVSPIDFSIRQRQQKDTLDLLRFTTGSAGSGGGSNNKLAQAAVIQRLDEADALVQATLLELMVAKELRMANVRYTVPKPFLVIVIVPHQHQTHISSQLLNRFFVSYSFCGDDEQSYVRPYHFRRTALIKSDEIQMLAERSHRVHINIDITRYIRDIVVGVRTHPLVSGGLTARTSRDLVSVTRSLATLFQHDFLTPDLVAVAADKVLGHRIHLIGPVTPSQVVSEVLRLVYVPV